MLERFWSVIKCQNPPVKFKIFDLNVLIFLYFKAKKVPHLRHEKDRTFFFDFSDVTAKETVVGAELRLYKEKSKKWKKNHEFQIQVYMLRQGKDPE